MFVYKHKRLNNFNVETTSMCIDHSVDAQMDKLEMWMYAGELVLDVLDKLSSCPAAAARVPLIRLSGKLRSSPLLSWSGARALVSARIIPAVCQWRLHIQMRCHHRHHTHSGQW